jgi:hypothetical protein
VDRLVAPARRGGSVLEYLYSHGRDPTVDYELAAFLLSQGTTFPNGFRLAGVGRPCVPFDLKYPTARLSYHVNVRHGHSSALLDALYPHDWLLGILMRRAAEAEGTLSTFSCDIAYSDSPTIGPSARIYFALRVIATRMVLSAASESDRVRVTEPGMRSACDWLCSSVVCRTGSPVQDPPR